MANHIDVRVLKDRFCVWLALITTMLFCSGLPVSAEDIPVKKIELPSSPDKLPYTFESIWTFNLNYRFGWVGSTDLNNNGTDEVLYVYGRDESSGGYTSAAVVEEEFLGHGAVEQINSAYSHWPIADVFLRDVWGDSLKELLLIRPVGDSVYLEVNLFSDSSAPETIYMLAAMARWGLAANGWKDLFIVPLTGIDLNGDDRRDLIFSRSSKVNNVEKADSAFERGLVAYDLVGDSVLWFFPLADLVNKKNFLVLDRPEGRKLIVAAVLACANSYSVNGMDSEHAYLIAIDDQGREVWRQTISEAGFFYPHMTTHDCDANGIPEIILDLDGRLTGNKNVTSLVCVDPLTGQIIKKAAPITRPDGVPFILPDSSAEGATILLSCVDEAAGRIFQYSLDLEFRGVWEGRFANIIMVENIVGDSAAEIIVGLLNGGSAMLDQNFEPIGITDIEGINQTYRHQKGTGLLSYTYQKAMILIPHKTPFLTMYFARYKWWLAVAAAVAVFFGILRITVWVRRLHQSTLGLPTLDRINAAVIVLDRKGRVKFFNRNPLVRELFGDDLHRSKAIEKSAMAKYPELVAAVRQSFQAPLLPYTERLQLTVSDRNYQIELVIYPRVEKGKTFIGKILVIEDISGKIAWERKAVLGEAAQRWIHRLKNSIATASIYLDNMAEDNKVLADLSDRAAFIRYYSEIRSQLGETADTAGKILRYTRITKPVLAWCDLNQVVEEAIAPYCLSTIPGITVAKRLQPNLSEVLIDPDQIKEIVDNLLSNAMKAVQDGGEVTVETRLASGLHDIQSDGRFVEIAVSDTGCGIPEGEIEKIFLPGFSRRGNGTGIGLAVVKEIIANHDGKIEVKSIEGQGSQFIIHLPMTAGVTHE